MGSTGKEVRSNITIFLYVVTFFLAMVLHELALEAASKAFSDMDELASAVTLFQFGFCFATPVFLTRGKALDSFPKSMKAGIPYITLSVVVAGATGLSTRSIMYVSYPTKVVFKSAKLIPTMIVSSILNPGAAKYGALDYFAALLLCAGTAGYVVGGSGVTNKSSTSSTSWRESYGVMLLLVSLVCDALVPNLQQHLMAPVRQATNTEKGQRALSTSAYLDKPTIPPSLGLSAASLMVNVNCVAFLGLLIYMTISGSLMEAIVVAIANPSLFVYLVIVGMSLGAAVLAYTKLIRASGSVVAVAVSTLRKVATVVLSYIVFPKSLLRVHVISGFVVLCGIVLSSISKKISNRKPKFNKGGLHLNDGNASAPLSAAHFLQNKKIREHIDEVSRRDAKLNNESPPGVANAN